MSKAKRIPAPEPQPLARRHVFTDKEGRLRGGWRIVIALALWLSASVATSFATGAAFTALFKAWNINARTVARAPGWTAQIYAWRGSLSNLVGSLVAIPVCLTLRRFMRPGACKRSTLCAFAVCALCGFGAVIVSMVLFLLTDSLRPMWPLTQPHITPGLPVLAAFYLIAALAEELLTKSVVLDGLRERWGFVPAAALSTLLFVVMNGGHRLDAICIINLALLGALCCRVHVGWGLFASVGLRWGQTLATVFPMGVGGGMHAVYRVYGVSESLLTGGDAGPMFGLWLTILLIIVHGALQYSKKKKHKTGTPR